MQLPPPPPSHSGPNLPLPPPPPPPMQNQPYGGPSPTPQSSSGLSGPLAARGTKVDVRISCRDLTSSDGTAPSPFVVVFAKTSGKTNWFELSRSETIAYTANPDFRRIFQMEYRFELYQELRVVIFDRSTQSDNLQQQALIGAADCTLGKIVAGSGSSLQMSLVNVARGSAPCGNVILTAEEIISAKKFITMQLSLAQLMSEEQSTAQQEYLSNLRTMANAPINAPRLEKRGAAAVFSRFRKEQRTPAVVPAHMQNVIKQQQQEKQEIQQQVHEIEQAPPPFVPFLSIMRAPKEAMSSHDPTSPNIPWEEVYKSTAIQNYVDLVEGVTLDEFTLSEYDLTEGDPNRLMKICVVQSQSGANGQIVGEHITNFSALSRMCANTPDAAVALEPLGRVVIHKYEERMQPSFMEYLRGGWCDFGLICAIDFTSSNGDPRRPGTRHYNSPMGGYEPPNEYEAAMRTVANMLASYSSDPRIPAYGFGANLPPDWKLSHCFPVREQHLADPCCAGVEGLIRAYKETLNRVQLFGPTMFSEVLRNAGVVVSRRTESAARSGSNCLPYTVFLILTDGEISDYDVTVQELIRMSVLPLSIVIIGIGDGDFGKMYSLDSSKGPLRLGTESALREFVQFVPYDQFQGDLSVLAERVLGGIPDQVLSYITKVRGQAVQ